MSSTRMIWLDWLRILAMVTIFFFHSARPFTIFPWHVMNSNPDVGFTLLDSFISGWIMPLFFAISGIATYFSLEKRGALQFVKDRFKRLMIPFLFVGLFIVLPVNVYYDAVFHHNFTGDFISFYLGTYFTKAFPFDINFSATYFADSNQGVYLWYLFWLFIFSLAAFNLFKWLKEERNRDRLSKLYNVYNSRGGLLLFAFPLIIVNIAAIPPFFVFPSGYGGWKLPAYLVIFITAYIMAISPQFEDSIKKNRMITLLVGIITSIIIILSTVIVSDPNAMNKYYIPVSTVWALNGWCWVTAILGFGSKYLSFDNKYLKVSNELVLPFYVLHQAIIVAIAYYIVELNIITIEKYILIVLISFSIIVILLYPISKINFLRFLFGMRQRVVKNENRNRISK